MLRTAIWSTAPRVATPSPWSTYRIASKPHKVQTQTAEPWGLGQDVNVQRNLSQRIAVFRAKLDAQRAPVGSSHRWTPAPWSFEALQF